MTSLHEPDALAAQALQLAEELAAGATFLAHIKRLCDSAHSHDLAAHLEAERLAIIDCASHANSSEGVSAFLEKRTPAFHAADTAFYLSNTCKTFVSKALQTFPRNYPQTGPHDLGTSQAVV